MAQVCKWLGVYLCMKNSPKTDLIHPDGTAFDAVIVWRETPKEKTGGMAYEVILKPASIESPARPPSPPKKERPLSQEYIEKKLKDAEERRQSHEMAKLEPVKKTNERIVIANQRINDLNHSFSKEAEKKLSEKLETMEEKRNAQIKGIQERLKEHAKRVEEVRQTGEKYTLELKGRIDRKMESRQENREAQLKAITDRIKEHERQIQKAMDEVQESTSKFSKVTEEKLIQKMNISMKNREDQLKQLQDRLQEHDQRIQIVRQNKLEKGNSEEAETA